MASANITVTNLRKQLRDSMGDRDKLSKLHSVLTDSINNSYGEEKQMLLKFRQEVKDALSCRVLDVR